MGNNICHKHLVPPAFFFLSLILFFVVLFKATNATLLANQIREGATNYKCIDKERDALLHFKSCIHEDPYGFLSTWGAKEATNDCCKWSGVTCNNQTGHVTNLILSGGNLKGEICPSLLNLSYLNHLDLSQNSFFGTIPMSIGSLTKLRYLHLSDNSFNGTIPRSIGSLTQLRYLYLSYNSFSGTLPPELGNLTRLQELYLKYTGSFTIENLDWLSHLSYLKNLYMDGISLAKVNKWVNIILGLEKLSYLSLSACRLSEVMHPYSYSSINSSSSIVSLYLMKNNLNASMNHWLSVLTSNRLENLVLSHNQINAIPEYLGNLCSLRSLNVYNNSLSSNFSDFLDNLSGCTSDTLEELVVSDNQLTGSLSDNIQHFTSLQVLYLTNNMLNGSLSEKVWQLPKLQFLMVSYNSLKGMIPENIGKTKIMAAYFFNNSLEGVPFEAHMSNISTFEIIDLSSCKLGPHYPRWIQSLKNLTYISIADTKISDTVPEDFWNMWPSRLTYLNLSSNNITGKVTDLLSNFDPQFSVLDLSFNNFYSHIPNVPSTLEKLDLSRNKFYGEIFFLCQITGGFLNFLDLSHNSFYGQIPDCLWYFKELKVLSLGHNNFSGRLPASIGSLIGLEVLYLYDNNFSEELPVSLQNCTKLTFLELGANKFSGDVPVWIGVNLLGLYALSLTSNNLSGTIPVQLCQLANLQILDLSMNNIYGTIPSCLNNLTAMVQDGFSPYQSVHSYYCSMRICETKGVRSSFGEYVDHAIIKWQGSVREFRNNLGLLKSIDLSNNNLTGEIPYELTRLDGLIALNLSNNFLLGEIPHSIGEIKSLLTLDLSKNNLSGELPLSISQMNLLNYMDVSYNNLSGRIPSGTQLQSFEPSRYYGNVALCGLPLSRYCPRDKEFKVSPLVGESENEEKGIDELQSWFYIGGATGFAIGFWITCGALLINRHGRNAFSDFFDSLKDWVYVTVVVFITKLQRIADP